MFRSFTLCFAGAPVSPTFKTWQAASDWALLHGFAKRAWGCLFTLVPGAEIKKL